MNTKSLGCGLIIVIFTIFSLFFASCKHSTTGIQDDVINFLKTFNEQIKAENAGSLSRYFEWERIALNTLIKVLIGKTNPIGHSKPLLKPT